MTPCTLVVPCYNEERTIGACLDALRDAPLPDGAEWLEWIVLDGASTDSTVERAAAWARDHQDVPLTIWRSAARLGKAVELEGARRHLLEHGTPETVMVVCDADARVEWRSLEALVAPFVSDPTLAVAWGICVPSGPRRRRLASRFQLAVVEGLARTSGPSAIRAEGRFFAIRPARLAGFSWRAGLVADDTQLAAYVAREATPHRSIESAIVEVLPAGSWHDFYLQTYRFFAAERRTEAALPSSSDAVPRSELLRALVHAARREPLGLPAYAMARSVAAAMHRYSPAPFEDRWKTAASTKEFPSDSRQAPAGTATRAPSHPRREDRTTTKRPQPSRVAHNAWGKALHTAGLVRCCEHGARTAAVVALGYVPGTARFLPNDLVVTARSGPTLRAPRAMTSYSPLIEVVVDNAYRLERLPWKESRSETLRVVDIGAHVGSFAVTLAWRYPRATVTCFEPAPETAAYLERNIRTNGLEDRVTFHQAAVGAAAGTARLLRTVAGSCEATLEPALAPAATEGIDVPVVDLATAFSLGGPPDLVKVDCEGGEYGIVLESDPALWESVRCILLEYHPVPGHSWSGLRAHLARLGFRVGWHDPGRIPGLGMAQLLR